MANGVDTIAEAHVAVIWPITSPRFGGAIALTARSIYRIAEASRSNTREVGRAEYEEGAVAVLAARKNLRIMRIGNMARLADFAGEKFVDFKSLIDGGVIAQLSFTLQTRTAADFLPATIARKGETFTVKRAPTEREIADMLFGWKVEAGVTSNSVLYAKDGVTVGIGAGEQDRVGVAVIARDKAYRNMAERLAYTRYQNAHRFLDAEKQAEIDAEVTAARGGLVGAAMISDAFFPFRDGVDVGLREGITAVIQPGGSLNDDEVIEAVNGPVH